MSNQPKTTAHTVPLIFLFSVSILSGVILMGLTYELWRSYQLVEGFRTQELRIAEVKGTIARLDEVLTMSARMAAVTGKPFWEERYKSYEAELDKALKEVIRLAPHAHEGEAAKKTDAANMKLVEMERRAFEMTRQGSLAEAQALLFSPEYENQKTIYAEGMAQFTDALQSHVVKRLESLRKRSLVIVAGNLILFPLSVIAWLAVFRILLKWKIARDQELHQSNEHLSMALSASGIGIWDWEIEKDVIVWDEYTRKLLDRKDVFKFDDFVQTIHPRDKERFRREIERCLARETEFETNFQVLKPDGSIAVMASRGRVYRDEKGKAVKMTGATWDITHQKKIEDAVHRSEINYRNMIENSADGILIVGENEGRILFANHAAAKLFDQSIPDLLGTQFGFPIAGEKITEINLITKDKKPRIVELHVVPTQWEEKSVYLISLRNVTERKQLEAQFIQSQKMDAVGKLIGGITHDFNNLLAVINGYSEMNIASLPEGDRLRSQLEEILKAGLRAKTLTSRLLTFSRQNVFAPKVIALNSLVLDLDKMARRLIGEDIELIIMPGEDLGLIKADPSQVEQVLINLVINARDAMPKGGKITIATRNVKISKEGELQDAAPGEYVLLTVSDNGTGMREEVKARIFEAFFTTKGQGKGTGLGLATCQSIVKQSQGIIRALSEWGQGTTFEIYFPRVQGKADILTAQKQSKDLPRGSETILLVEDDASVRKLASTILTKQGYTVLEAENGEMALRVAQTQKDKDIQLAVVDLVMPQMSGREFANQAKYLCPKLKVLFVSGYTDDQVIRHGVETAQTNFLQKPFTAASLVFKVREVLDNKLS